MKKYILIFAILFMFISSLVYGQSSYIYQHGWDNAGVFPKTLSTPGSILFYDDYLSELIGAGWIGPHATSTMTTSYYLQIPLAQPTLGQSLQAGTPAANISTMYWAKGAGTQGTNQNPTAPANTTTYFMQGLAGTITPTKTGNILIIISGTVAGLVNTTVDNGIQYQISYGTSTAPSNAGALAGTQVGPVQEYTSAIAPTAYGDVNVPFSVSSVVTGLTINTAYWIDLAAKSVTTASAMGLTNVQVSVIEF